jgi:hypothetical protein
MLEELALREHTRWMRQTTRDGWRHAFETDKPKLLHNYLLPWRKGDLAPYAGFAEYLRDKELPEEERERKKDRTAIRNIVTILKSIGYKSLRREVRLGEPGLPRRSNNLSTMPTGGDADRPPKAGHQVRIALTPRRLSKGLFLLPGR